MARSNATYWKSGVGIRRISLPAALLLPVVVGFASAADFTWNGASPMNNNMNNGANWAGGVNPSPFTGTADLIFAGSTRPTPNADISYLINTLSFTGTTTGFTIGGNGITLQTDAGVPPAIRNNDARAHTIQNSVFFENNATYEVATGGTLTMNGPVSGSVNLTKSGAGILALADETSVTGTLTLSQGTIRILSANRLPVTMQISATAGSTLDLNGFAQTLGPLSGSTAITLGTGGSLTLQQTANTALGGTVTGTNATFVKAGNSTLTLSSAMSHSGSTQISAGTLRLSASNVLSSQATHTVNGTLDLFGFNDTIGALAGSGTVEMGAGTFTTGGNNADTTFSGKILGSGTLVKTGTGIFTLSFALNQDGPVSVGQGTLVLGVTNTLPATGGTISVTSGANLQANLAQSINRTLDLSGTLRSDTTGAPAWSGSAEIQIASSNATIRSSGTSTFTLGGSGAITGSSTLSVQANSTSTITITRPISLTGGSSGLSKTGSGTLRLGGSAKSWQGNTSIQEGTLRLNAANLIPDQSTVSLFAAGAFDLDGFNETIRALSGAGAVTLGAGTLTIAPSTTVGHSGVISGTGGLIVESSAGFQDFSSANSYTGPTEVRAGGKLRLTSQGAISPSARLTIAATGEINISADTTVGSLAGAGLIALTGNPTIELGSDNTDATWSGNFIDSASLRKTGTGTFTCTTAINAVTSIDIQEGTMVVSNGAPSSSVAVSAGARLNAQSLITSLNVHGTVDPGVGSPAGSSLIVTGAVTLQPASAIEWTVSDWTGSIGTGYDYISAGSLNLAGNQLNPVRVRVRLPASLSNYSAASRTFTLASSLTDITGFATPMGIIVEIIENPLAIQGTFSLSLSENQRQLLLNYQPPIVGYEAWIAGFYPPGADRAPDADPDHDGIANLIEFIIGSIPTTAESAAVSRQKLPTIEDDGTHLVFRFRRNQAVIGYGDDLRVEYGSNLTTWSWLTAASPGSEVAPIPGDPGFDLVTVRIPKPPEGRLFARLRAMIPPV